MKKLPEKCYQCGNRIASVSPGCMLRVSNKFAKCKPTPLFRAEIKEKEKLNQIKGA